MRIRAEGSLAVIVGDFITGLRYFGQGFSMLARRPRLLLTGMLPAVLTTAVLLGAMIALIVNVDHVAVLLTPFANGWPDGGRQLMRLAAGIALVGVVLLLGLVAFTAVTLPRRRAVLRAHRRADRRRPGRCQQGHLELSWWKQFVSGLRDGVVLLVRSLVFTIPLFLAGFLPVVGQSVVPVLAALLTAWFMALEVTAVPFYRRGISLRHRTALLRRRRALALGLGLPAALLCMIPLLAIVVMPVAFAGGVLIRAGRPRPGGSPRGYRGGPPGSVLAGSCHRGHRRHCRDHHLPLQRGGAADTVTVMGPDAPVIGVVRLDALNSESVVPLIVPPDTTAVVAPLVCSGR